MTEKELKRLSRQDLLELLLEAEKENETLKAELERLRVEAADRRLLLDRVGSIAEASLLVNGVFTSAQAAADQYIENVKRVCEEKASQVRQAEDIVKKAQDEAEKMREETKKVCRRMIRQAKEESDRYWETAHSEREV